VAFDLLYSGGPMTHSAERTEPTVSAKAFSPPRNVVCEWCCDWTDAIVRVPPQLTRLSGLTAEQVIERWPKMTEFINHMPFRVVSIVDDNHLVAHAPRARHTDPESFVDGRKAGGEALTGAHAGQPSLDFHGGRLAP
jgi:hypothetical protein